MKELWYYLFPFGKTLEDRGKEFFKGTVQMALAAGLVILSAALADQWEGCSVCWMPAVPIGFLGMVRTVAALK